MKKRFFILISIFLIIIVVININNINAITKTITRDILKIYGEPINHETGLINNSYFGISSDGKDESNTTRGINNAIEYAAKNNIEYIKLEKGNYSIKGTTATSGIILKSNITLDLNGSVIKHIKNAQTTYAAIKIKDVENVKIINGIIIGDRKEHNYTNIESTHEWGMGIRLLGAINVELYNLQIMDMTGDGIYISEGTERTSENILICNNNIYNCRRQGISVITAKKLKIENNEIHNIKGTNPQSGIDIERNNENQICENTIIANNKLYAFESGVAIYTHKGITNLKIFNNEIQGVIEVKSPNETIEEYDNKFIT